MMVEPSTTTDSSAVEPTVTLEPWTNPDPWMATCTGSSFQNVDGDSPVIMNVSELEPPRPPPWPPLFAPAPPVPPWLTSSGGIHDVPTWTKPAATTRVPSALMDLTAPHRADAEMRGRRLER